MDVKEFIKKECPKCKNNEVNCSECKYSIKKTKECVIGGIKNCEYYEEE